MAQSLSQLKSLSNHEIKKIWAALVFAVYKLGDDRMAMTQKEGDDPSDDIIDYGSMRMALDCFKGKFRLNGDALLLPRPPLIECHPLGCC